MRKPLFLKIFAGYTLVTLTMSILMLVFSSSVIRTSYRDVTAKRLEYEGIPLRALIAPLVQRRDLAALNRTVREFGSSTDARITIIDPQGVVLADSERDPSTMDNHAHRPEVEQAMRGKTGRSIRYSATLKKDFLYLALPFDGARKVIGVLRLSIPLDHVDTLMKSLLAHLALITACILAVSLAMAAMISHVVSAPIKELARASGRLASGDLSIRVPPARNDEIRDLTEAFNHMAESLERSFREFSARKDELETIVSSVSEALFVLDAQGRLTVYNDAALRLAGVANAQGRYYWELFRSKDMGALLESTSPDQVSGEVELGGKTFLCSVGRVPSGDERVVTLHDITDLKRMERYKKELVVNVSHELRTPLAAIKGFAETCLDEAGGEMREHLLVILRHTNRLISIVNDLLVLSEMDERPMPKVQDTRIDDLAGNVTALYAQRIEDKGLDLAWEGGGFSLRTDPFLVEQILINLVDNAVKYTERGSITVRASKQGRTTTIEVTDTGIGIPREHQRRIFERFYVVDKSRSRSTGGTGLGLSIARNAATILGGAIEVESMPGSGTTFRVTLPDLEPRDA